MASPAIQTRENHTRFDPKFHFFLIPGSFALFVWAVVRFVREMSSDSALLALLAFFLMLAILNTRLYSLKVQDRLIRLEEKLRFSSLTPTGAEIPKLGEGQWVALRFASDAELPALAQKAASQQLTGKQIKEAIQNWRGDYFRV